MVVFLSGLPPCDGATDGVVSKVCEVIRKGFPIVQLADASFIKGAIFHHNENSHVMLSPAFVARSEDPVLSFCRMYRVLNRKF